MKRKILVAISAAVAVILILTVWLVWMKGDQSVRELAGSWMLYEGGSIAPDVLTFNADGTGVAYVLSDAYQDNSMIDVQIPRSCLEHAENFRWSTAGGVLTFTYDSGKHESLEMAFDTTFAVRILSLRDGIGGGGWIPAEIVD